LADCISVSVHHISKSFGNVVALKDVSVDFHPGMITGLVGDNGAGKSSLVKCLTGVLVPDEGYIKIGDREYASMDPRKAIELGISTVYQDLSLVDSLSISQNIFLGRELRKYRFFLDSRSMDEQSALILKELGISMPYMDTRTNLRNKRSKTESYSVNV
jgi:ABC-type sugar transport system ATPase subunit